MDNIALEKYVVGQQLYYKEFEGKSPDYQQ
jgi:hypothetical protein